jgi:hypothetical protein
MKLRGRERHVDVFEEGLSGDPSYSGRSLDEVIAGLAGLFAAESVGKNEGFDKLTSAHQKTGAVDGPLMFHIHSAFLSPHPIFVPVVTERGCRSADDCCKWSDCTRRKVAGQLHKNCANGGISVRESDGMNPDQAWVQSNRGWCTSGGGFGGGREKAVDAFMLGSLNLHKGCTG